MTQILQSKRIGKRGKIRLGTSAVIYSDGNAVQIVALNFKAEIISGEASLSGETIDWGYCSLAEIDKLDMLLDHRSRIQDTFSKEITTFIR